MINELAEKTGTAIGTIRYQTELELIDNIFQVQQKNFEDEYFRNKYQEDEKYQKEANKYARDRAEQDALKKIETDKQTQSLINKSATSKYDIAYNEYKKEELSKQSQEFNDLLDSLGSVFKEQYMSLYGDVGQAFLVNFSD